MKKILIILFSLLFSINLVAQQKVDDYYVDLERMPVFEKKCYGYDTNSERAKCSDEALKKEINDEVLVFTEGDKFDNHWPQNRTFIRFFVEANGLVSDVEIVKSSGNTSIDSIAFEQIQEIEKFYAPGFLENEPVKTQVIVQYKLTLSAKPNDVINFMEQMILE